MDKPSKSTLSPDEVKKFEKENRARYRSRARARKAGAGEHLSHAMG
jgi:hypothetical protein